MTEIPEVLLSYEEVEREPIPVHYIRRIRKGFSSWSEAHCSAPLGAVCRLACATPDCTAEFWPCGGDDFDLFQPGKPHMLRDQGYCGIVEWLNAEDVFDCCEDGGAAERYEGPITVRWDYVEEAYLWRRLQPSGGG